MKWTVSRIWIGKGNLVILVIISPFILLFVADLLGSNAGGAGNALGLQIIGGPKVTILASKTSRKYSIVLLYVWRIAIQIQKL